MGAQNKESERLMKIKRIPLLLMMLLWLTSSFCLAAEDMQFVDANGSTGYYVDVSSIAYGTASEGGGETAASYEVVTARVAVIKANMNRRFLYLMQFNKATSTYQILASKVQKYDTKEVVEIRDVPNPALPYTVGSPMHTIVEFIYEQPRKN